MTSNRLTFLFCVLVAIICMTGCKNHKDNNICAHAETSGVYYWKTVLEIDSVERNFLIENDVHRAYVRFFDIVVDESPLAMDPVVPNATLQVKDSFPVNEIVPTVYITIDALRRMKSTEDEWAEKIVKRVFNMCSYNELSVPKELHLDCDWTMNSDTIFFNICREVKRELQLRNPKATLSATIRLHQLSQTPPPVDYGVLMVYNTGSFKNPYENNSILSVENVRPYIKYLSKYPLHLDYAFPIFSWNLLYQEERFRGILNVKVKLPDTMLKPLENNRFEVVYDTLINNIPIQKGDIIRKEDVSFKTIMEVKALIEKESNDNRHSIILYSLDGQNLNNYSENEFKKIYQ